MSDGPVTEDGKAEKAGTGRVKSMRPNSGPWWGISGTDPHLCYCEWSVDPGLTSDDRRGWAQANPALGIRISEETVEREFGALTEPSRRSPHRRSEALVVTSSSGVGGAPVTGQEADERKR